MNLDHNGLFDDTADPLPDLVGLYRAEQFVLWKPVRESAERSSTTAVCCISTIPIGKKIYTLFNDGFFWRAGENTFGRAALFGWDFSIRGDN